MITPAPLGSAWLSKPQWGFWCGRLVVASLGGRGSAGFFGGDYKADGVCCEEEHFVDVWMGKRIYEHLCMEYLTGI